MSTFSSAFASKRSSSSSDFGMPPRASSWRSGGGAKPSGPPPPSAKSFTDFPALGGAKVMPAPAPVMDFKAAAMAAPPPKPIAAPAVKEPAAAEPYQFPSYFSTGRNRIFTEAEAEMIDRTPAHLRERRIAMLRSGVITYEDEEEDDGWPEEEEEGEFNAHLTSDRRRGDKGVW